MVTIKVVTLRGWDSQEGHCRHCCVCGQAALVCGRDSACPQGAGHLLGAAVPLCLACGEAYCTEGELLQVA